MPSIGFSPPLSQVFHFLTYVALVHLPVKAMTQALISGSALGVGGGKLREWWWFLNVPGWSISSTPPLATSLNQREYRSQGSSGAWDGSMLFLCVGEEYATGWSSLTPQGPVSAPEVITESIICSFCNWLPQVLKPTAKIHKWGMRFTMTLTHFVECFKCTFGGRLFIYCPHFISVLINYLCIQFLCLFNKVSDTRLGTQDALEKTIHVDHVLIFSWNLDSLRRNKQ